MHETERCFDLVDKPVGHSSRLVNRQVKVVPSVPLVLTFKYRVSSDFFVKKFEALHGSTLDSDSMNMSEGSTWNDMLHCANAIPKRVISSSCHSCVVAADFAPGLTLSFRYHFLLRFFFG